MPGSSSCLGDDGSGVTGLLETCWCGLVPTILHTFPKRCFSGTGLLLDGSEEETAHDKSKRVSTEKKEAQSERGREGARWRVIQFVAST